MKVYYGWVILSVIILIEGLSGFGRTASFSPFLKDLCHDLTLTSSQICGAYGIANLVSGFFLPKIGKFYDQKKASYFLVLFIFCFGLAFLGLSFLKFLLLPSFLNFCCLFICFLGIRISVQSYALTGRCIIASWFQAKRGLATGISCLALSLIASSMPWINLQLHKRFVWQNIWLIIGLTWIVIMPWLARLVKKAPHKSLRPDIRNRKLQFRRELFPIFLLIMAALLFKAFQTTSLAFHLVAICEELGTNTERVTLALMCTPITTALAIFITGHFFEKIGAKTVLGLFFLLDIMLLFLVKHIASTTGILALFCIAAGSYWGLRQIIAYMVIPKLFGVQSIGAINGWASSCLCLGSSIGPFIFGLLHDFCSYQFALNICVYISIVFLLAFLRIQRHIPS